MAVEKPYGTWKSPITADLIVSDSIGLSEVILSEEAIYWLEMRPKERGRQVIVRQGEDGKIEDLIPPPYNARTRVHEYGGGSFLVASDAVFFSNFEDQRIYRQRQGALPRPLTPEGAYRYADAVLDQTRNRLICVREDHTDNTREAVNALISIPLDGRGTVSVLAEGADFYASPRISPAGDCLAWLTWNHPHMPWEGTELWMASLNKEGQLESETHLAGSSEESILQPEWSPTGELYFISDRNGWWNLYRWQAGEAVAVAPMKAEFASPPWMLGLSTYAFVAPERIICTYSRQGKDYLAHINTTTGGLETWEVPYTAIGYVRTCAGRAAAIAASPAEFPAVIQWNLARGQREVLRSASEASVAADYVSVGEAIEFPTAKGKRAYAFFYPPKNKDYRGPPQEKPPLLVISHGGPTAATDNTLNLKIQYWTSRGIAVLDVNYRGSSGYGREYRRQLKGQWGVADVEDCVYGARYLVNRGDVDPARLIIRGSSAGGFTTLAALTFYGEVFKAGASYYGVSDLEALARETHKFESRYLDWLIGPYPEQADLYRSRSPIHGAARLSCPVIFFQGLEDKIVPPGQTERMVAALRSKGLPVAYVPFEDEQHGFRQAENIKRALESELYFYSRIFNFEVADEIEPVSIANL